MSRVEELKKKAEASWEGCHGCNESDRDMWINGYIKGALANEIQLPTDEEIHPNSPYESNSDWDIGYHNGWKQGAKWMRDKIKGGGDEN